MLLLYRACNEVAVYRFLQDKEDYQRRNNTDDDSGKDYLPLCAVRTDEEALKA